MLKYKKKKNNLSIKDLRFISKYLKLLPDYIREYKPQKDILKYVLQVRKLIRNSKK